jgi:hypothetical protein
VFFVDKEINIGALTPGPVKLARDIVYELIQEADSEHGEAVMTQSRVILEMPEAAFEKMRGKERFTEIGIAQGGVKQYLLQKALPTKTAK